MSQCRSPAAGWVSFVALPGFDPSLSRTAWTCLKASRCAGALLGAGEWACGSYRCVISTLRPKCKTAAPEAAVRCQIWCAAFPGFVLQPAALKFSLKTFYQPSRDCVQVSLAFAWARGDCTGSVLRLAMTVLGLSFTTKCFFLSLTLLSDTNRRTNYLQCQINVCLTVW